MDFGQLVYDRLPMRCGRYYMYKIAVALFPITTRMRTAFTMLLYGRIHHRFMNIDLFIECSMHD